MLKELLLSNQRINENPLVLFNTLFTVVQHETDVKGYWLDKGKLYIDNIKQVEYSIIDSEHFNRKIALMFCEGEQAVFYKDIKNIGNIRYANGTHQVLINRIEIIEDNEPTESYLKLLLKNCNGLTVYKIDNGKFLIEIYK